jgi:hypothetical protein
MAGPGRGFDEGGGGGGGGGRDLWLQKQAVDKRASSYLLHSDKYGGCTR